MKTILFRAVLVFLISYPGRQTRSAQSNSPDAQLKGTLTDKSGGGVGGVSVGRATRRRSPGAPLEGH